MTNSAAAMALGVLQKRFCLSSIGGQIRVLDSSQVRDVLSGASSESVQFLKLPDADILMRRFLEVQPIAANPIGVIKEFKTSPQTLVVDQVAFSPSTTPPTTINFWVSPAAVAQAGDWSVLKHFLHVVLCDGNDDTYNYLLRYLAHMVQRPDEKPGVMLVFLGGQGTGKGMFFRLLQRLWPRTTLVTSDVEAVLGRFNSCLERSFAVCLDEALFYGDRKSQDRLKSLITEPTLTIEEKYQPKRSIGSLHRFFAASNHDHFAQVEQDDRRMVIFRVSDRFQQDTTYFGQVYSAIQSSRTIDALFHELSQLDLSDFNIREKPSTAELVRQKIKSLSGFDRYWYEVLSTGNLTAGTKENSLYSNLRSFEWTSSVFVPTAILTRNYKAFDHSAGRHQTVQQSEVHRRLPRLSPSAVSTRREVDRKVDFEGGVKRGYLLPSLDTAREDFSRHFGARIDWDNCGTVHIATPSSDALWLTDLEDCQLGYRLPALVAGAG